MNRFTRIKKEAKFTLFFIIIGASTWFWEPLFDLIAHPNIPYWDLVTLNAFPEQVFLRLFISILYTVFSIYFLWILQEKKRIKASFDQLEGFFSDKRGLAFQYLNMAPMFILALDLDAKVLFINKKGCEIIGTRKEDIIGKYWFDNLEPAYMRPQIDARYRIMVRGGIPLVEHMENEVRTSKNDIRLISFHLALMYDEVGKISGLLVCGEDITEQRSSEKHLKESEQQFRTLAGSLQTYLDIAAVVFLVLDAQGVVKMINKKGCAILGGTEADIIGKKWFDTFIPERIKNETTHQFWIILARGAKGQEYSESAILTKQGGERLIAWHHAEIRNFSGEITGVISSGEDITDRRRAELALQESEQRFRDLANTVPQIIFEMDLEGKFLYISDSGLLANGYTREDYNRGLNVLDMIVPEDLERAKASIRDMVLTPKERSTEYTGIRRDGTRFPARTYTRPILRGGHVVGVRGLIVDMTEQKQAEERLRTVYEDTLRLAIMKSNLLTFAAHELKTPLVPILGWVDLIKSSIEHGKKIEQVIGLEEITSIFNAAQRLDHIIGTFLDVSRLESGHFSLNRKIHSTRTLIQNAVQNIKAIAKSHNIHIHVDVEDVNLATDGFRMEQVFINILSNAIKYSPQDCDVYVSSRHNDSFFEYIFTDQGYGFTSDELAEACKPFSRSFLQRKSEQGISGTGVGLYLSKGIVEQHGGTIQISSEGRNKGSTITISLPTKVTIDSTELEADLGAGSSIEF